ncbi:glutamate racemase [Pseudomonas sp. F1_0610]|uniref:glutamate racemase n=1 Tax=Pseudomonas sp. F1_0610 TaxID=3114284 RepID=UPI0039C3039B
MNSVVFAKNAINPSAPVGVFDSGVGGLSVLKEIRQRLPSEQLFYIADEAYVPYGEKSPDFIIQRSLAITQFLIEQGIKALVIACNTATAAAAGEIRTHWPWLPVVAMEPAVKPATQATRSGIVGVLATTGTLKSAKFAALLDRFAGNVRVITQPCPGLVEEIEQGNLATAEVKQLLAHYALPLVEQGCDTLILGCTHYPFLKNALSELVGDQIQIIDTGEAVARRLEFVLTQQQLLNQQSVNFKHDRFYSSGDLTRFAQVLPILWGEVEAIFNFTSTEELS